MNLNILIVLLVLVSSCKVSNIQDINKDNSNRDININTHMVALDPLNNILVLDDRNNLHLYSNRQKTATYADNTLGQITHIDASDPLKIVIFKKDYGTISILDNTLSEIEQINLAEKGYNEVPVVAISNEGYLWIYDRTDYRIKKIRKDGSLILESSSMLDYGQQGIDPSFIQERNGKVFIQDYNLGIYLFDNLGQYIQLFPFKIQHNIQFDGQFMCYFNEEKFSCYHSFLYNEEEFEIPENKKAGLLNVKAGNNNFYLIYQDGIDIIPIRS